MFLLCHQKAQQGLQGSFSSAGSELSLSGSPLLLPQPQCDVRCQLCQLFGKSLCWTDCREVKILRASSVHVLGHLVFRVLDQLMLPPCAPLLLWVLFHLWATVILCILICFAALQLLRFCPWPLDACPCYSFASAALFSVLIKWRHVILTDIISCLCSRLPCGSRSAVFGQHWEILGDMSLHPPEPVVSEVV